jgi:bifunctional isochorismate lyase/aryl carrier protein
MQSPDRLSRRKISPYPLPGGDQLARNKVHWPLRLDECVLVIHDMQNCWLSLFDNAGPVVANVEALRHAAKALAIPVIYTKAVRPRTLAERALGLDMWGPGLGATHVTEADCAICEALTPAPDDYVIDKPRYSGFFRTELEDVLSLINRNHVILTGVFAHHGVLLTAADAYMRNYKVSMVVDATADYSLADHEKALEYVAEVCGALTTTAAVRSAFEA